MAKNKQVKKEKVLLPKQAENFVRHNTEVLPDFFDGLGIIGKNSKLQKRLEEILEQRAEQRKDVLKFSKILTGFSLGLLAFLCILQAIVRLQNPEFRIFDGIEFQLLVTGVFGQIIGVIYIISRSLWNDKNYLDTLDKYL